MKGTLSEIVEKVGLKKRAYQSFFGADGTAGHDAFVDLATFCHAFGAEVIPGDHDNTLRLAGRREAFFHIWQFLHLEPQDLVALYPKIVLNGE